VRAGAPGHARGGGSGGAARNAPAAIAATALLATAAGAWPYTVDDAFIVGRYAWRWARGLGWTFRDGPATDGVTGPLWVLPGALAELLGVDPVLAQKGLGALATALAAVLVVRDLRRGQGGARSGWLAAGLLSGQATLGIWGIGGLETGLATLLLTWAALTRRALALGLAAALLAATRPETAPAVMVLLLWRRSATAWALALAGALGVLAWRGWMFGHLMPLSFWAKGGSPAQGAAYAASGVLVCTGLGGLPLAAIGAGTTRRLRPLGVAALAQLLTVAALGGDWMPGYRLLAPTLPLYAALAARGGWRLSLRRPRWAAAAALVALLMPALDLAAQLGPVREAGAARRAAAPLARRLAGVESVALVDVGYLVYRADADVFDLGGLTDPVVAHAPGGHLSKEVPIAYLAARDPAVLLLHAAAPPEVDEEGRLGRLAGYPVERYVAGSAWSRARFRVREVVPYAPGYWYVWLERPGSGGHRGAHRRGGQPVDGFPGARAVHEGARRRGRAGWGDLAEDLGSQMRR